MPNLDYNPQQMRNLSLLPRSLALWLTLGLSLPNPALGMRNLEPAESGLEEEIAQALGGANATGVTGLEERTSGQIQRIEGPESILQLTFPEGKDLELYQFAGTDNIFLVETRTQPILHRIMGRWRFLHEFKTTRGKHELIAPEELGPDEGYDQDFEKGNVDPTGLTGQLYQTGISRPTRKRPRPIVADDFRMEDLAEAFTLAGENLLPEERWLRSMLESSGALVRATPGWTAPRSGGVMGLSQDMERRKAGSRRRLGLHELDHILFHTRGEYRGKIHADRLGLPTDARAIVEDTLVAHGNYDLMDDRILDKEYSAYFRDEISLLEKWQMFLDTPEAELAALPPSQAEAHRRVAQALKGPDGSIRQEWRTWLSATSKRLIETARPYWEKGLAAKTEGGLEEGSLPRDVQQAADGVIRAWNGYLVHIPGLQATPTDLARWLNILKQPARYPPEVRREATLGTRNDNFASQMVNLADAIVQTELTDLGKRSSLIDSIVAYLNRSLQQASAGGLEEGIDPVVVALLKDLAMSGNVNVALGQVSQRLPQFSPAQRYGFF